MSELRPYPAAVEQLRALGLRLVSIPGGYRVNYRDGKETTAYDTEDLDDAISKAKEMAANPPPPPLPPMGPVGRKHTRRGQMLTHNRKIAARRLRQASRAAREAEKP